MAVVLRLIVRNYSSYLFKSRVPYNPSLYPFYSTSTEKKPLINDSVFNLLLQKHHFSPAAAAEIASATTRLRNPENTDSLLSFLKENGFSNTHLEKILKYKPSFISADLEKSVEPKIKIFQELGFSNNEIADILANNPSILFRSMDNRVIPALRVLRRVLGSDANAVKLLMKCGRFLAYDLEKYTVPNIEFLKSCGVPVDQIIRCLHSHPRFMLLKPETVRHAAAKADEMGVKRSSKMYIHGVRVRSSMSDEAWELKLQAFRVVLGFSEDDILKAFRKHPPAFSVSAKKMENVKEILVTTGKYGVEDIVNYPISLSCSIDNRYKPRLRALAVLERKNLVKKWPTLSVLCLLNDEYFFKRFIGPNVDEVGHLFVAKSGKTKELHHSKL